MNEATGIDMDQGLAQEPIGRYGCSGRGLSGPKIGPKWGQITLYSDLAVCWLPARPDRACAPAHTHRAICWRIDEPRGITQLSEAGKPRFGCAWNRLYP